LFTGKHYPILTTEEAVAQIQNGDTVSFSGFTPAGAAKAVPLALARRAVEEHAKGKLQGAGAHRSIQRVQY